MTQRKIALSIEEAADYTGIGRNTLRKLVEWKKLPVLKVGRKVLIKTDMLELFMEANEGRDLRDKGNVKAGSIYGGGTGAAKNGNKVSVPAGSYNSKSRQSIAGTYSTADKKSSVYTQKPVKKKKGSLFGWLMVLVIICASLPEIRDSLKDSLAPILEEEFGDMFGSGADSASYKLMAGDVLEVGENVDGGIVPGYYIASCSNGFVSFMIMGEDGENGSMTVTDGVERKITLKEGDLIGIINTESEDSSLLLTVR